MSIFITKISLYLKLISRIIKYKQKYISIIVIFLIALLARIVFFIFEKNSPLFLYPIIDELEYLERAQYLANNNFSYPKVYWHPPLYQYFLAILMKIGLENKSILIIQNIMGILGTLILYFSLEKINKKIGFYTSLLWSIYPIQLFIENKFLMENMYIFLLILFTHNILKEKQNYMTILFSGFLSSLLIITKPTFILFIILYLLFMLFKLNCYNIKKIIIYISISLLLPLMVTIKNYYTSGDKIIFVSSNGAVNLYIGNSNNIRKTLNIRPKDWWDNFFVPIYTQVGLKEPEEQNPYELDDYFIKKVINENKNLETFAKNLLIKFIVSFFSYETPRNFDIYSYREVNNYLRYLIWKKPLYFPLSLFIYSAFLFMIKNNWRKDNIKIIFLLTISHWLPLIIFFNAFRYRLICVPYLIFLSINFYYLYWRNMNWQIVNIILIILLGTGIFNKILIIQYISPAETYNYYAFALFKKGELNRALNYYNRALRYNLEEDERYAILNDMASIYFIKKDYHSAKNNLNICLNTKDEHLKNKVLFNLALIYFRESEYVKAYHLISKIEKPDKEALQLRGELIQRILTSSNSTEQLKSDTNRKGEN
ncbi:MAG: glycosyltransferase family 39 protein [Candidatus Hydrogenedentota bacterium]